MRSAAGNAALPKALQSRTTKRRSDRRKKQDRRDKARKTTILQGPESKELASAAWMDALEGVLATNAGDNDGDDSYDELDELENKKGSKKRRKPTKKQQELAGSLPKRFKQRTVANILLEEVNREDGVAYAWLEDEARVSRKRGTKSLQLPARKFCPVTGIEGIYTEPKSGLPYANLKALEQVRERPPPWMTLGGSLAYHEAVKSIRDEDEA